MKKLLLPIIVLLAFNINAQLPAFPGAEGFGRYATGGRGGAVYHVTNLNDSGTGSFRDAVSQSNRIVVFDVGGIITLNSVCVVKKNITIAGQTAPGDGITITGQRVAFNSDSGNDIVRYIRVRLPRAAGSGVDAMSISDNADNLIFDHVSVTWGADGTFDINSTDAENITIQDCIIGQGADWHGHSTGGLIQCGPISIIRTLWIDNNTRNPKIRFQHEFINCVLYNWGTNGFIMGDTENADSYCNMIGNYFIAGPSGSASNYLTRSTARYYVYESDNWLDGDKDGVLNGTQLVAADGDYLTATVVTTPYSYPGVNTVLSAQDAVAHIIANVGPSLVRDAVDELLITQLSSYGTLGSIVQDETSNGIPNEGLGTVYNGPKPLDTDNDGMPDEWEDANGLNKNTNDAMTIAANSYANIENYINSINTSFPYLKYPTGIYSSVKTENSITLNWTNNDEADQIFIEYGTSASNFSGSVYVTGDQTIATIPGLASGTTYYFRLKAKNSTAESAYSDVVSVQTQFAPVPPVPCSSPAPSNGSTLNFFEETILTWDNTTTELGGTLYYDVYFGTSQDQMDLVASSITNKFFAVGDLSASQTYYWRVKVTNDLGSDNGSVWSFTTGSGTVGRILYLSFDETSGTIADNLEYDNDAVSHNMTTTWIPGHKNNCLYFNASPVSAGMVINHYSALSMGTSSFTISLWFKSTGGSITDIYLFHKGTHKDTYGSLGTGKWIGIQYQKGSRLTFALDDNSNKTDLNITDDPDQYFNFSWHHLVCIRDASADKLKMYIDGVKIGEKTDGTGNISESAELVIGNCNYNFDTPFYGYMDEVEMFNYALSDAEVNYIYNTTINSVKGIKLNSNDLNVYPNPFKDHLIITIPEMNSNRSIIQLIDLTGKLIIEKSVMSNEVNITLDGLDNLSKGIYICKIIGSQGYYIQKVMKQ